MALICSKSILLKSFGRLFNSTFRAFSSAISGNSNRHSIRERYSESNVDPKWNQLTNCNEKAKCPPVKEKSELICKNHSAPYQRHWIENPTELKIFKVPVTIQPLPEPPRRPRKSTQNMSGCKQSSPECTNVLSSEKTDLCLKILSPNCPEVRNPTKCIKHTLPADCLRILAPVPSFHECLKDPVKSLSKTECFCLATKPPCKPTQLAYK